MSTQITGYSDDTIDIVCFNDGLKWVALAKEEDIRQ